jgi:uncharacterized protein YegL
MLHSFYTVGLAASFALIAGSAHADLGECAGQQAQSPPVMRCGVGIAQQSPPRVEVVFVLDTTGSMGGLIESAKDKIWSIATTIAQAQPSPEIRMGLVAYRDRGDDYVTKRTPMTDDLDALYSELTAYQARGGGDGPESVNQALFEAVERFDWSEGDDVLRIVYLVGDAPPKMNFEDDVKYPATCRLAREKNILINTIQCGGAINTREVWQTIAQNANGAFAAIAQDGGTRTIATPYDHEIKQLDQELSSLMIDYGDQKTIASQASKRTRSAEIAETAAPEAAADRAMYNQSLAGRSNLYGRQELVSDVAAGRVSLDDVPAEHLSDALRALPREELAAMISENQARRDAIALRLGELATARRDFRAKALAEQPATGFDAEVVEILTNQAATIGLSIRGSD